MKNERSLKIIKNQKLTSDTVSNKLCHIITRSIVIILRKYIYSHIYQLNSCSNWNMDQQFLHIHSQGKQKNEC